MGTVPTVAAQASSTSSESTNRYTGPATRSAKRKLDQQDAAASPLLSKRARRSVDGNVDASERLLASCRGGSTRRRRVVAGSDDENDESDKRPETPKRDHAAQTEESTEGEPMSSSQKPVNETDGSGSKNYSSEPMSSSRKTVSGADDSSSENDSSGPTSSPRKTVSGIEAESPEKAAEDPSGTIDTTSTVSAESTSEGNSDDKASMKAGKRETRTKGKHVRTVRGLLNNSNMCYITSVVQFFDAAFEGHDLDTVLGPVESTEPFIDPELKIKDRLPKRGAKTTKSKTSRLQAGVAGRIDKLGKDGRLDALSPRKHFRALLQRMQQIKRKNEDEDENKDKSKSQGSPNLLSPYIFQQILAYGDETASRQHLDGTEQEDSYEYFQAVLAGLKDNSGVDPSDEESAEKPAIIDSLFNFKSETASVCSNESCDHKGAVVHAINNVQTIQAIQTRKKVTVEDLLRESQVSELDQNCPKCGQKTMERVTEFKEVADNFVVHINRVAENPKTNKKTKIMSGVELPWGPIEVCGKQYVLDAIIKHKGSSVSAGHYNVLRRRSDDWRTFDNLAMWFRFDDHRVSTIEKNHIRDHRDRGQSAMLLFKDVESIPNLGAY